MVISKTPFRKIFTQNVLIIPLNYYFQTSSRHKSVKILQTGNLIIYFSETLSDSQQLFPPPLLMTRFLLLRIPSTESYGLLTHRTF